MVSRLLVGVAAFGALWAPTAAPQSPGDAAGAPTISVSRFYRGSVDRTLFDVFARVPFSALTAEGERAIYRVTFVVRDSTGLQLLDQSWTQTVPRRLLAVMGGSTVEHVSFATAAGHYALEVTVADSTTGRTVRANTELLAFSGMPGASDLLLTTDMREATGADTTPQVGEIRKGPILMQASGDAVLTPRQARLGYYLELYTAKPETVDVGVRVVRSDGGQVVAVAPQRRALPTGGALQRAMLDLSGLPPGRYQLEVTTAGSDSSVRRMTGFGMTGFETENAMVRVTPSQSRSRFDGMTETQLDSAYDPLIYLMHSDETGIFSGLTVEGKRSYLRQFWGKRDLIPGTAANEEEESFYRRIAEANRRFREGGSSETPGWRTDRGRIFIKNGEPDEKLQRPQAGNTAPYEVWRYSRVRSLLFVFLDQTRFGNYALIYTNDRHEVSRPDWMELLGSEAVKDVQQF